MNTKFVILSCVGVIVILGFVGWKWKQRAENYESLLIADKLPLEEATKCVATFVDGGGPYYKPDAPFRELIADTNAEGEILTVTGKVLFYDCETPLDNAVLDIWQANAEGNYEDEWYRGKVTADEEGNYTFTTVVPKGYGEGTGYRPPHIHFKVHYNDRELITSQMFFPEVKGREGFDDAYIMELETVENDGVITHKGYHNIILPLSSI